MKLRDFFHKTVPRILIMLVVLNLSGMSMGSTKAIPKVEPVQKTMMAQNKKIQYKFVLLPMTVFGTTSNPELEKMIQDNGENGWELVQILEGHGLAIFKKS